MKENKVDKSSRRYIWTFTTYFTEGFPFVMIRTISSVFFRDMKVPLENIGLTALYGLPWILKFLWGPQVDEYGTKRKWLLGVQTVMAGILILAALFIPLENNVRFIAILFFFGAIVAATHDIAIDGYYMEALDKEDQAKFVGVRTMAYRIAMMTGTGAVVTIGTTLGWFLGFLSAAVIFGIFLVIHFFILQEVQIPTKSFRDLLIKGLRVKTFIILASLLGAIIGARLFFQSQFYEGLKIKFPLLQKIYFSHWMAILLLIALLVVGLMHKKLKGMILRDPDSFYSRAFVLFMERKRIAVILFFIIFLRAGEWTVTTMAAPFIVDLGIKVHYGWITGLVGFPCAIVGALLGGWMISRYGLNRVMWPFILAQNLTNIIYMFLALHLEHFVKINTGVENPESIGALNLALVAAVHGFDQFASGLGNAVLMTYLMRICHTEYKAAHYALGSGLMNLSGLFAGLSSGFIAGALGYHWVFGVSFFYSVPAMLAIPFLPYLADNSKKAG